MSERWEVPVSGIQVERDGRLCCTSRRIDGRIDGTEAAAIGPADERFARAGKARPGVGALAEEIAGSAPLVVRAVERTLAGDRLDRLRAATDHELAEQVRPMVTEDAREGIAAYAERRRAAPPCQPGLRRRGPHHRHPTGAPTPGRRAARPGHRPAGPLPPTTTNEVRRP